MQVFLSLSGDRSKAVAQTLESWLRLIIQSVEPWISVEIGKGSRWNQEIAKRLEESKVGIICLTAENLTASWILFEAGAVSKTRDAIVCTFLLDITPSDVEPPLGDFQHTTFQKEDMRRLVRDINSAVVRADEKGLSATDLDNLFDVFWPKLNEDLAKIKAQAAPAKKVRRSEREILEEILEVVRRQERRVERPAGSGRWKALAKKSIDEVDGLQIFRPAGYQPVAAPTGSRLIRMRLPGRATPVLAVRTPEGAMIELVRKSGDAEAKPDTAATG